MTREHAPRFVRASRLYDPVTGERRSWWIGTAKSPVACVRRPSPTYVGGGER